MVDPINQSNVGGKRKNILQFSLVFRLGFGYSINHSFIDTYPNNSSVNKRKNPKSFVHGWIEGKKGKETITSNNVLKALTPRGVCL